MASLEFNKMMAAILTAGVLASGSGVVSRMLYQPHAPEEVAYRVEVPEGAGGAAAPAAEEAVPPIAPLLAAASAEAGEAVARRCTACHSFEQGGPSRIGPNLWNVVGRDIAGVEGFSYSSALQGMEGVWDYEALSQFLHDPQGWAPGTNMSFAGLRGAEDRANIVVYLRSLAEDPAPLPSPEEVAAAEAAAQQPAAAGAAEGEAGAPDAAAGAGAGAGAGGEPIGQMVAAASPEEGEAGAPDAAAGAGGEPIGQMVAAASPEEGQAAARACVACHSFEQGGAHKIGPNLWEVIGRDIAGAEGFSYSDALASMEGAWDYENLAAFLQDPRGWAPGTKMAFAGLRSPEQVAAVVAYLRSLSENPAPLPEGG